MGLKPGRRLDTDAFKRIGQIAIFLNAMSTHPDILEATDLPQRIDDIPIGNIEQAIRDFKSRQKNHNLPEWGQTLEEFLLGNFPGFGANFREHTQKGETL